MRSSLSLLVCAVVVTAMLAGCGGGEGAAPAPGPPGSPDTQETTVGPFVIETAAATDVTIQDIASEGHAAFVAMTSSGQINWLGTVEMMDRLVFSRLVSGFLEVHVCDFFGQNITKLTSLGTNARYPEWSPDGSRIVFSTELGNADIYVMDADGGNLQNLTNTATHTEESPTWSPDGSTIAYISDEGAQTDVYRMFSDGTTHLRLTNDAIAESGTCWNPTSDEIAYARAGDIYYVDADGMAATQVTATGSVEECDPTWHPNGTDVAYSRDTADTNWDIYTDDRAGCSSTLFAGSWATDDFPCYSTDGKWIAFASTRDEFAVGSTIFAQQTEPPHRMIQITNVWDDHPNLGSPAPTVTRTLIGPWNSDHGYHPMYTYAVCGIAAFGDEGYLNFIRPGIRVSDAASVQVSALSAGLDLVGVELRANAIFNLREDKGMGVDPTLWSFDPTAEALALYLDADTGKLVSVLQPSGSAPTGVAAASASAKGGSTVIEGSFSRVWDGSGTLVGEGSISRVELGPAGEVTAR